MDVGSLFSNCSVHVVLWLKCTLGSVPLCAWLFDTSSLFLHGGNGCLKYWALLILVLFFRKVYIDMPNNAHSLTGFKSHANAH